MSHTEGSFLKGRGRRQSISGIIGGFYFAPAGISKRRKHITGNSPPAPAHRRRFRLSPSVRPPVANRSHFALLQSKQVHSVPIRLVGATGSYPCRDIRRLQRSHGFGKQPVTTLYIEKSSLSLSSSLRIGLSNRRATRDSWRTCSASFLSGRVVWSFARSLGSFH